MSKDGGHHCRASEILLHVREREFLVQDSDC
jgi:hypothetical protein